MSTALLSRPRERALPAGGGERPTFERVLLGVWEGLLATGSAVCPVCGGVMRRRGQGGSCSRCGASLG